jgi:ribosomal protein L40E
VNSTLARVVFCVLVTLAVIWFLLIVAVGVSLLPLYPGAVGLFSVVLTILILSIPSIVCILVGRWIYRRSKPMTPTRPPPPPPRPAPVFAPQPTPPPPPASVVIREREVVLIVCPSCGAKNPQGKHKCANCGANL